MTEIKQIEETFHNLPPTFHAWLALIWLISCSFLKRIDATLTFWGKMPDTVRLFEMRSRQRRSVSNCIIDKDVDPDWA